MKRALVVLSMLAIPAMAQAQSGEFQTGNEIISQLKACEGRRCSTDEFRDWLFAMGYVIGVHDATKTVSHCSPPNITQGQVVSVFLKRVEVVPEYWNKSADRLVVAALSTAWPCEDQEETPSSNLLY